MPVQAHLNRTWVAKWLIMTTLLAGFGLWCLRDATVTYPRSNERYAIYEEYAESDDLTGWVEHAHEQGWSDDPPKQYSDLDIATQWGMLALVWPLGLAALGMVLWFRGRSIIADEEGIISHRGERIPYSAITAIDKERWDSKGIAYVHWEDGEESGRVKIDDWVFRDAWRVLDEIEDQTGLGEPVPG